MFPHLFVLLLFTGGLLLPSLPLSGAEEYYVTPTQPPNPACPSGKPCHTLNDYAKNTSSLFSGKDDVSLLFLDGVHILNLGYTILEISNTTSLTMAGVNVSSMADNPKIYVKSDIAIMNVSLIHMENISIDAHNDDIIPYNDVTVTDVKNFTLNQLVLTNCLLVIVGTAEVHITISNSIYQFTSMDVNVCYRNQCFMNTTSIKLTIKRSRVHNSSVNINSLCSVEYVDPRFHLDTKVEDTIFSGGDITIKPETEINGLIIHLCTNSHLSIQDSHFTNNSTLMMISQRENLDGRILMLKNVTFFNNINTNYTSISLFLVGLANTTIDSCHFEGNVGYPSFFVIYSVGVILFRGNTTFVNNVGGRGGAMHLIGSTMYFEPTTNITFVNNRATNVGGAIFYERLTSLQYYQLYIGKDILLLASPAYKCFYQLTFDCDDISNHLVYFINNSAQNGGDHMYGASSKDLCFFSSVFSSEVWHKVFYFDNTSSSGLSPVSSDPKRVCLCENGEPECADYSYIVQERQFT